MRRAGIWQVVALLVATALAYGTLLLWFYPPLRAASAGLPPFDLRIGGYGVAEATEYLTALSPEGARLYLGPVRAADTLLPLLTVMTLLLPLGLHRLAPGMVLGLGLPALVYGGLDLAENAAVAGLLRAGLPPQTDAVALASFFTQAKFLALALAALVALALLIRGWKWR